MKVFVTKADSDFWYDIKTFDTMEDLQKFIKKCHHSVVVGINRYTEIEDFKFWDGMKKKDMPIIIECPLHVTIYNDYMD